MRVVLKKFHEFFHDFFTRKKQLLIQGKSQGLSFLLHFYFFAGLERSSASASLAFLALIPQSLATARA